MAKIYLDSARAESWALPVGCPPVQGVTTNPSLVFQAGLPVTLNTYLGLISAVADHGLAELMVQLPNSQPEQAREWLKALQPAAVARKVGLTIKLPCAPEWDACIDAVRAEQQDVLLTGLSNAVQLLWAQHKGVQYVAPYVGRLANDGRNVWALMEACVAVQATGPRLLAASIKTPEVLGQLVAVGAAAVTLPPASLVAWSTDALTQSAVKQFDLDIQSSLKITQH
ncbi:transaldolase family protein [Rhodoferax sp.]|uniref:transaldolase family protein n=1 Tax=Rhodoferax sp. TaxID=50421 RepID=UPI0025E8DE53|nr:transaldolase family protein [Rhodoferax sp.]